MGKWEEGSQNSVLGIGQSLPPVYTTQQCCYTIETQQMQLQQRNKDLGRRRDKNRRWYHGMMELFPSVVIPSFFFGGGEEGMGEGADTNKSQVPHSATQ